MRQLLTAFALLCMLITPAAARYVTADQVAVAAKRHGVPLSLALAVIHMESGGRCDARGRAGELGPLQIKPATARASAIAARSALCDPARQDSRWE
jgi:soluble lytic murein transglycosylase-like protein